ncbi:MAG: molybdopterin-dependent oxidoreductase [Bryobacteraceae bacterium]
MAIISRRDLIVAASAGRLLAQEPTSFPAQNTSVPLSGIEGDTTPTEKFFIRDHFREPAVSMSGWRLQIEGRVSRPLELAFADILESPVKDIQAVLECAGNPTTGAAAANAVWRGVPLAAILERAGAAPDAVAVMLEGADSGRLFPESPDMKYCQVVPFEKCMQPESLLAFKVNGRFLARSNGFPVRALFPGWYAMDSVKWLQRIVVLGLSDRAEDFQRSGMNRLYNRNTKTAAGDVQVSRLTDIQVRSAIAWPPENARLPRGRYIVRGFAWTGSGVIRKVAFSADAGRSWGPAQLESQPKPFTWVRWNYTWSATPGDHILMSRAADSAGREQALARDPSRKDGYELNYCVPVPCTVR